MKITVNYNQTFGTIEVSVDKNSDLNFVITDKKFIISKKTFSLLLKMLLFMGIISPRLLYGILEEYYTYRKEIKNAT